MEAYLSGQILCAAYAHRPVVVIWYRTTAINKIKMRIHPIPLLISAILASTILSACTTQNQPAAPVNQNGTQNVTPVTSASATQQDEIFKRESERLHNMEKQMNDTVKSGDIGKCGAIEDKTFADQCMAQILAGGAKSASDITVCNPAASDSVKSQCLTLVKAKK